jgi:hypothetical protein
LSAPKTEGEDAGGAKADAKGVKARAKSKFLIESMVK